MTIDQDEIVQQVARFYLDSGDFNGCPAERLVQTASADADFRPVIEGLVTSRKLEVLTCDIDANPHIKRLPVPPIERQLEGFRNASTLVHVCLYPHAGVLQSMVSASRYEGRPFELELALGAPQLEPHAFDLSVLEFYRNDPRYHYECDDMHGRVSISDAYYSSSSVAHRDKVLLETFGFAYNDDLDRAVTTFLRYLANLTPEHQQIWKAKQLGDEFQMHPDYFRSEIFGEWPQRLPLFTAFWMELELVNKMAIAMGRPQLFRDTMARPKKFAFLVRPTLGEFNDFALLLDKVISDNINRTFFSSDVSGEEDSVRADGKIVVRQKGTLALLEEWTRRRFQMRDWTPFDEAISTFRQIRKLRQSPAHALQRDVFDQRYFREQRELMIRAYEAVRVLRMMFEKHPAAKAVQVDRLLRDGKISDY